LKKSAATKEWIRKTKCIVRVFQTLTASCPNTERIATFRKNKSIVSLIQETKKRDGVLCMKNAFSSTPM
jgi:hypothetical protein